MKKFALTALAAVIAATGFASTASAGSRNNDDEWRHQGQRDRDGGDRDRRRDDNREARRDRDGNDNWRHHHRRDHWRHNHNPRYVFRYDRADYCFVKKVRVYDDWGNLYIKKVRVCR